MEIYKRRRFFKQFFFIYVISRANFLLLNILKHITHFITQAIKYIMKYLQLMVSSSKEESRCCWLSFLEAQVSEILKVNISVVVFAIFSCKKSKNIRNHPHNLPALFSPSGWLQFSKMSVINNEMEIILNAMNIVLLCSHHQSFLYFPTVKCQNVWNLLFVSSIFAAFSLNMKNIVFTKCLLSLINTFYFSFVHFLIMCTVRATGKNEKLKIFTKGNAFEKREKCPTEIFLS